MPKEEEMKEAMAAAAEEAETPLEKLRCLCLSKGYNGILLFGLMFRRHDADGSGTLNKEEFPDLLVQFGFEVSEEDVNGMFEGFDEDGSGTINYNEFLDKLRPEMTEARVEVVEKAFAKLDESGDGVVTVDDIRDKYNGADHPKVLAGEASEDEVLEHFLSRFEGGTQEDGKVTKEEFLEYYSGLSKSIDEDEYFCEMMKLCWKLEDEE